MSSISIPPPTSTLFPETPAFRCPVITDSEYVSLHDNESSNIISCRNKNILIVYFILN